MSTAANKQVSRRFLEKLWNEQDKYIIDELISDDFVDHTVPPSSSTKIPLGIEQLKQAFETIQNELYGVHVSIKDQIAEDDRVVTHMIWACTLRSDEDATKPAQTITARGIGIDRIERGEIMENWNTLDVLYRLISQLNMADPFSDPGAPFPGAVACKNNRDCDPGYRCDSVSKTCQRI